MVVWLGGLYIFLLTSTTCLYIEVHIISFCVPYISLALHVLLYSDIDLFANTHFVHLCMFVRTCECVFRRSHG